MQDGMTSDTTPQSSTPLRWTSSSWILISGFLFIIALIIIVWYPLVEEYFAYYDAEYPWYLQMDWLLIGIFLFMSAMVTINADLRKDSLLIFIGLAGGLCIEAWGTNTELWAYYTGERPPLWIIPAWAIAAISIERMARLTSPWFSRVSRAWIDRLYYAFMLFFLGLFLLFILPRQFNPFNLLAYLAVVVIVFIPQDRRVSLVTFIMGASLGFFLEYWGTTRACWQYYNHATPPLFSVLAHGIASLAFWQVRRLALWLWSTLLAVLKQPRQVSGI